MKIMNRIKTLLIIVGLPFLLCAEQTISIKIDHAQEKKMPLFIGLIKPDAYLKSVIAIVIDALSCPHQKKTGFTITMRDFADVPKKSELQELAAQGFEVALFIEHDRGSLEWRLYDTAKTAMTTGKKTKIRAKPAATALSLADKIWHSLTGQDGSFSTYIAYCQEMPESKKLFFKQVMITPAFAFDPHELVSGDKYLAPRWNSDPFSPLLLCSVIRPDKILLLSVSMNKKRKIVSNFDGVNMLPSFSQDGLHVVYCFTQDGKSQLFKYSYDVVKKESNMERITFNGGSNLSPTLRENGDIIFCSDYQRHSPQVYYYHADTKETTPITDGGYCACPSFSEAMNAIAYCKLVNGVAQVFVYTCADQKHMQMTFDAANKDECCWSPCGRYIAYAWEQGATKRIACMNSITKEQFFITPATVRCNYPAWSPYYANEIF